MRDYNLLYLINQGIKNIWTNRVLSITSIAVMTTCLIFVGSAYLFTVNVENMLKYLQEQNEIIVFLYDIDDANRTEQVESAKTKINQLSNIRSYTYISKEQGLEDLRLEWGEQAYLLDGFEQRNTLPDSFNISIINIELMDQTVKGLEDIVEIEIVRATTDSATTLTQLNNIVITFGWALIIALSIISMVIVSNAIKATIFTRRKEINTMKYVGATNTFIRTPFVVEGFVMGVMSSGFAYVIVWQSYEYALKNLTQNATAFLDEIYKTLIPFQDVALNIGITFAVIGAFLGTVGSSISSRKHTNV